jgi:hypothetical protein
MQPRHFVAIAQAELKSKICVAAELERPVDERPYMLIVTGYPADNAMVPVIGKEPLDRIASFKV